MTEFVIVLNMLAVIWLACRVDTTIIFKLFDKIDSIKEKKRLKM